MAIPKSLGSAGTIPRQLESSAKKTPAAATKKPVKPRSPASGSSAGKPPPKTPVSPTTPSPVVTPPTSETLEGATILGAADIISEDPLNAPGPLTPQNLAGDDWLDNLDLPPPASGATNTPSTPARFNPYPAPNPIQPVGHAPNTAPAAAQTCAQHSSMPAVQACMLCGEGVCKTCLFEFPDGTKCCPKCATSDTMQLSVHRKGMLYGGVACAVFASCFLALTLAGLLQDLAMLPFGGIIIEAGISVPIIMGLGVSTGAYNSYEGNPVLLWVGAIWNGILLLVWGGFILLIAAMGSF